MPEITALEKHACAACGAQAEWNPAKQRLVCPFCGTEAPYEVNPSTGEIQELDLVRALRELPEEERGWATEARSVQCQSCRAVTVFPAARVAQNCEFCGSPALVDYTEIKAPVRPQSLLPFKISEAEVRERIRSWYASKWLAPSALKRRAMLDRIRGLYVPYWTFDAKVHCPWEAEAGHYYYTTETYRDSQGQRRTRQVRHVRWEPASGVIDHFFDDEPVPATHGVHMRLLRAVEPFPTSELVPYDTAYLSGFAVEHYQVVLLDAVRESERQMRAQLERTCAAAVPGDTHRNLRVYPEYSARTFKHILAPIWLLAYTYGRSQYQMVVNGYTGKIAGEYPKSVWKILLLVLAGLILLALIAYSQG